VNLRHLTYQSHVFAEPPALRDLLQRAPSVRRALFVDGVPKGFIGRRYTADSSVALLEQEGREQILRFGSSGLSDAIGVDLVTGHVVEIIDVRAFASLFVNTSIEQFTQTVKAIIDRFPYYDRDTTDEEIQAIASELLHTIRSIDSEAAVPDRYWSTFVDDVEIGDLSTEAILAIDG
jgi:hypothetical protein